jgi:hypothetical protein
MQPDAHDPFLTQLCAYLDRCTATASYAQAARDMGGVRITTLSKALETVMEKDVAVQRPLRAAWIVSRITGLPARGFFDKARVLGRRVDDEGTFHIAELAALRRLP